MTERLLLAFHFGICEQQIITPQWWQGCFGTYCPIKQNYFGLIFSASEHS